MCKSCIACGNTIPSNALVCSKCLYYQKKWKNNLKYVANIAGALTIAGALIIYSIKIFPEVKKVIFWTNDISLVAFETNIFQFGKRPYDSKAIIFNKGDGTIYVSHILIRGINYKEEPFSVNFQIRELLKPNEMANIVHPKTINDTWDNYAYRFIHNVTDQQWRNLRESANAKYNLCFRKRFYSKHDPRFIQIQEFHGSNFRYFDTKGSLYYKPINSIDYIEQKFEVLGLIVGLKHSSCGWEEELNTFPLEKVTKIIKFEHKKPIDLQNIPTP